MHLSWINSNIVKRSFVFTFADAELRMASKEDLELMVVVMDEWATVVTTCNISLDQPQETYQRVECLQLQLIVRLLRCSALQKQVAGLCLSTYAMLMIEVFVCTCI